MEARRWELETRYRVLSTEIKMLDQELLSRAVRLDLLEAKRDRYAASIDWIADRVAALEERTLAQLRQAAGQARADAELARRDVEGMDPVLVRLSEANAELGQAIDELGTILLQQLDAMPDFNSLRQQQEQRRSRLASGNTRRLGHRGPKRGDSAMPRLQSRVVSRQLASNPLFWVMCLLVGTLLWSRRRIRVAIGGLAGRVGKPTTDRFGLTLRVLGLTLLLALPLPLLLAASGWLLVVRRRLSYEAALERHRVASEAARSEQREPGGETAELRFDEPQVDFSTLSADTRALIRFSLGFVILIGFLLIWSDTLSALRVFEDHVLWNKTVSVGGEEQQRPITLLHLGLALLFAVGTWVLLRRLPSLLEIILLRRTALSAADRYAVTTLTSYVIGAIGILLVLGTLGVSWMHLQWMAAALSVGIGFGLQEIVANFVSGLIILFERPIRVGDTVTVGDTDGVVTKIRIRATTIRNWDRKELLVPNKEFVTGRLLNWSLSDPVTRIVLVVGVAYGSDVDQASAIMTGIAQANEHVIDEPPPVVTFDTFGDNALTLTLRAFVESVDVRMGTISALNRAINEAFADAGISIAFPQRDLHLDTTRPLQIELRRTQAGADHYDQ